MLWYSMEISCGGRQVYDTTGRWRTVMKDRIEIGRGDITRLAVDAIVNAANESLLGGGGVDGAIHRAAGPELLEHCRRVGGCPTGEARITPGFSLPARWVIHTVGPIWSGGDRGEDDLLRSCYRSVFALVPENGVRTLAFPSISTGAYGFPVERACRIALDEALSFLAGNETAERITFVCFDAGTHDAYMEAFRETAG
jgi:O-acetyl-ADP-ribose deacetylase (regulator of RNase III)